MADQRRPIDTVESWNRAYLATGSRADAGAYAQEWRSTEELVATYAADPTEDAAGQGLTAVHWRGGSTEFEAGLRLLRSDIARERGAGADVLAQLGWADRTFLEPSVDALLQLLEDPDIGVIQSAAIALGHRGSPRAIVPLLALASHPEAQVRDGVVFGLMPHQTPECAAAMIRLSADDDRAVRDWATFVLGSQFTIDTPELRAALHARVDDTDAEVRGEALVGLAKRRDQAIVDRVRAELAGEFHGIWAVEAAEELADATLAPELRLLRARLGGEEPEYFRDAIDRAIAACAKSATSVGEAPTK